MQSLNTHGALLYSLLYCNSCQLKLLNLIRVCVYYSLCLAILVRCEDVACQSLSICKQVTNSKLN
jgi:hypothetical protein